MIIIAIIEIYYLFIVKNSTGEEYKLYHRNHSEDARGFSHGRNRGDTGGIPDPKSPSL